VLEVEMLALVDEAEVEEVEALVDEALVEDVETEVVEVVVPKLNGFRAIAEAVQFKRAPILSQAIVVAPGAIDNCLSDCPPDPTAPVTLFLEFCPVAAEIEVSVVARASTIIAPVETVVTDREDDPPPAPVVPVVPAWASTGLSGSTPEYEAAPVPLTEAEFRVIAIVLVPRAGFTR
jgi:hypothetical protein